MTVCAALIRTRTEVLSPREFFDYVESSPRVNQKWLSRARENQPCFVANMLLHYQHLMKIAGLAHNLHHRCDGEFVASKKEYHA